MLLGTILHAGHASVAGTRIPVARRIASGFTEALAERARILRVGMPLDPGADLTAVIDGGHTHSVLGHIELARRKGSKIALGGCRRNDGDFGQGFFVQPTILADVTPSVTFP